MNANDRHRLVQWLSRYQGSEIVRVATLDQLAEFGVRYSRVEDALIDEPTLRRVSRNTMTRDDFYARFQDQARVRLVTDPGNWRGIAIVEVALRCCLLAGIELDPAHGVRGTQTRFLAYLNVLKETHNAQRNPEAQDRPS